MTTEYVVIDRDQMRAKIAFGAVGGLAFLLFAGVLASQWLLGLALFAVIWLLNLASVADLVHRVRVTEAGMVEFVRLRGVRRIPAGTIRSIQGRMDRDEDQKVIWRIRVRLARGTINLRGFSQAAAFIADVRRLNPAVAVVGKWPDDFAAPGDSLLGPPGPFDPGRSS